MAKSNLKLAMRQEHMELVGEPPAVANGRCVGWPGGPRVWARRPVQTTS